MKQAVFLIFCEFLFAGISLVSAAEAPAIPIFPGAKNFIPDKQPVLAAVIQETLRGFPGGMPLLAVSEKSFVAEAKPEKVFQFYLKELKGINALKQGKNLWDEVDPGDLKSGASTPVYYVNYTGPNGVNYSFNWYRKENNSDITVNSIVFYRHYGNDQGIKTAIICTVKTYSDSVARIIPGEEELGAPVYPGSVFDSAGSSAMGGSIFSYVFLTTDPLEKVATFYEQKTGLKAMKGEPTPGNVSYNFIRYPAKFPGENNLSILKDDRTEKPFSGKTRIFFSLNKSE